MDKLKSECVPCTPHEETQYVQLPDKFCECKEITTIAQIPSGVIKKTTLIEDCYKNMLKNMTNQYLCSSIRAC